MDISSSNAVMMLAVNTSSGVPLIAAVQIQGFSTDDAWDGDHVEIAQVVMGVDGRMSAGAVPVIKKQRITLQADSPSMPIFDAWVAAQDPNIGAGGIMTANETLKIPAIGTTFTLAVGVLSGYTPLPKGGKILGPRQFEITWQTILAAPSL